MAIDTEITMKIRHRDEITNLDILDLVKLIDAGMSECARMGSSHLVSSHKQDLITLRGWWEHFTHRFEHHAASPELWMPNYAPNPLQVGIPPVLIRVENPSVQHCMNLMAALRAQLLTGESADFVAGFHAREIEAVLRPTIAKGAAYIEEAITDLEKPTHTYLPDVNYQAPGVNV
jgi:hypothetical protein